MVPFSVVAPKLDLVSIGLGSAKNSAALQTAGSGVCGTPFCVMTNA